MKIFPFIQFWIRRLIITQPFFWRLKNSLSIIWCVGWLPSNVSGVCKQIKSKSWNWIKGVESNPEIKGSWAITSKPSPCKYEITFESVRRNKHLFAHSYCFTFFSGFPDIPSSSSASIDILCISLSESLYLSSSLMSSQ